MYTPTPLACHPSSCRNGPRCNPERSVSDACPAAFPNMWWSRARQLETSEGDEGEGGLDPCGRGDEEVEFGLDGSSEGTYTFYITPQGDDLAAVATRPARYHRYPNCLCLNLMIHKAVRTLVVASLHFHLSPSGDRRYQYCHHYHLLSVPCLSVVIHGLFNCLPSYVLACGRYIPLSP
jgi:hypothetical protein